MRATVETAPLDTWRKYQRRSEDALDIFWMVYVRSVTSCGEGLGAAN